MVKVKKWQWSKEGSLVIKTNEESYNKKLHCGIVIIYK